MEKRRSTSKQGKRKPQFVSAGGGDIGGLVVWGGALAVAGLAAAFAVRKGRRRGANEISSRRHKEEQASQGLQFILQTSSSSTFHCNPCCASDGSTKMVATQIDSCELFSNESLILEENPASTNNCRNENSKNDYQGILIKDDSKQESINSCDNYSGIEELPSPVFDSHSLYVQENRIENDSGEESPLMEVVEEGIEEKEASDDVKIGERISSMHLVEENGDDDQEEETKEESPLVEINALKKEEPIDSLKICEEKNSSVHSVKETEDDDQEYGKESPVVERIEVWKEEESFDDAPKASEDITSTERSIEDEDDDQEEEEEEEDDNEECVMEKGDENSEVTGSSSAGSNEEEIWPLESVEAMSQALKNTSINQQFSAAKIMEEDETNETQECIHLDNSEINIVDNCRYNHQTTHASTFLKKEETLEFTAANDQPKCLAKWRNLVWHMLVLALMVLLLFTLRNAIF
ncbi:hypothetical protein P3X46_003228 [Hevea brasiliensis]|uniref:Uncharacterized protein n=1 Tax=Hevea brasiliensis TaxID=3981 RepID=A0ABQ9N6B4_HEVBR|nr:uncharacterized protein LOC110659271 [Hevea brasiliensis]KAJ9187811.1 hypothetical protein P3X46_003228 [Hevea brasiliensis]